MIDVVERRARPTAARPRRAELVTIAAPLEESELPDAAVRPRPRQVHPASHRRRLRCASELRRVLRPGGRAIFIENAGDNPLLTLRAQPARRTMRHPAAGHRGRASADVATTSTTCARVFARVTAHYPVFEFLVLFDRQVLRFRYRTRSSRAIRATRQRRPPLRAARCGGSPTASSSSSRSSPAPARRVRNAVARSRCSCLVEERQVAGGTSARRCRTSLGADARHQLGQRIDISVAPRRVARRGARASRHRGRRRYGSWPVTTGRPGGQVLAELRRVAKRADAVDALGQARDVHRREVATELLARHAAREVNTRRRGRSPLRPPVAARPLPSPTRTTCTSSRDGAGDRANELQAVAIAGAIAPVQRPDDAEHDRVRRRCRAPVARPRDLPGSAGLAAGPSSRRSSRAVLRASWRGRRGRASSR